jgi:hypothetical protein
MNALPDDDWMMELATRYPVALVELLHPSAPPHEPLALSGIECREDSEPVPTALLARLDAGMAAQSGAAHVSQILEKFGVLRLYLDGRVTDAMRDASSVAPVETGKHARSVQNPVAPGSWMAGCQRCATSTRPRVPRSTRLWKMPSENVLGCYRKNDFDAAAGT